MNISFKNILLSTSIMVLPLKSVYYAESMKQIDKKIPKIPSVIDFGEKAGLARAFVDEKLQMYKDTENNRLLNFIKMPKPRKELDVGKTKFVGSPEFLNMFLKGVLKGKGEQFVKAQEKHGVNATFLVGIANLESGNGLSDYAINRNNIAGMRNKDGYMFFSSVDECIDRMAANLKKNYINKGLTTIQRINGKYAENPEWAKLVVERMSPMYKASKCKIYDFNRAKKIN